MLGCLANMSMPSYDWLGLILRHNLLMFLAQRCGTGAGVPDDEVLLELVMLLALLCTPATSDLLAGTPLVCSTALRPNIPSEHERPASTLDHEPNMPLHASGCMH